jgi:hypothetical protein
MDALEPYRGAVIRILNEIARIPDPSGEIQSEVICDRQKDHYLLMQIGWDGGSRIHGVLVHVDVIDGKLWIQHDGTERGIAEELVAAGVPKDRIVLAFRPPQARKYTDYAAA